MTQEHITRRLLLTSEICLQLQCYAQEITRDNVSRAYLESFASRALKRCAELYALSRPEAFAEPQAQPMRLEAFDNVKPIRAAVAHDYCTIGDDPDAA